MGSSGCSVLQSKSGTGTYSCSSMTGPATMTEPCCSGRGTDPETRTETSFSTSVADTDTRA